MRVATTTIQIVIRVAGVLQIGLGLLFWTYNALNLIPMHMLVGLIIVLCLWVLALLAARVGVPARLVAVAFGWGLIVPILGMTQDQLLPGAAHWIIQVVHLAVGIAALGLAEALGRGIRARSVASALQRATA
jgi:hypothetical protein